MNVAQEIIMHTVERDIGVEKAHKIKKNTNNKEIPILGQTVKIINKG